MSTFKTQAEMTTALEFIQYLEQLRSGTVGVDGTNQPLGRLAGNADALLDDLHRVRTPAMFHFTGSMAHTTGTWSWTGVITLNLVSQINAIYANTITTGSKAIATGEVAYLVVDRTTAAVWADTNIVVEPLATFLATLAGNDTRTDYVPLAVGVGGDIVLMDGQWLRDGYSLTNSGATDTQYGQQTEVTIVRENQKENLNLMLTRGGDISWDEPSNSITFSDDLLIEFPAAGGGDNYIVAGTYVITPDQVMYVTLTRVPGASINISGTITIVDASTGVPNTDDIFVLAIHKNSDDRIYLAGGTALSNGETVALGGVRTGVQWHYQEVGTALQPTNFTVSRPFRVETGELMVFRNGIKAIASKAVWRGGSYPTGALDVTEGGIEDWESYVEEDPLSDGTGTRIIWIRDETGAAEAVARDPAVNDPIFTWPGADDLINAFIGVQGQKPTVTIPDGIYGFELVWTPDATTLKTAGGHLVSNGEKYTNSGATPITAGTADASIEGPLVSTLTETWVYAYLAPPLTGAGSPRMLVSNLPPDDSADLAGVHPANTGYRFLTSVYVTSGGVFNAMNKRGSWVSLGEDPSAGATGPDVTSNFSGKVTGLFETVNLSTNLPVTHVGTVRVHVQAECDAGVTVGETVRLEIKPIWEGFVSREMLQIKPGGAPDEVNFEFEPIAPDGQFHARFQTGATQGMTTVIYAAILGYSEGRSTSGDTLE